MSTEPMTISWHIEKHKLPNINGLQLHNERKNTKDAEHIDATLSDQNYQYDYGKKGTYNQRIKHEIEERYTGKKAPRKDAVVDIQSTIQFGAAFASLDEKKQRELMRTASAYVSDMLGGRQNVLQYNEHFDEPEGLPHAHMDMVPITEDGRLSAKEFINGPKSLKELQDGLMKHMQDKYPELDFKSAKEADRGFANGKSLDDYKRLTAAKKDADEAMEAVKAENKQLHQSQRALKEAAMDELAELSPDETMDAVEFRTSLDALRLKKPGKAEELGSEPAPIAEPEGRQQFKWLEPFERIAERLKSAREKWREKVEERAEREAYKNSIKAVDAAMENDRRDYGFLEENKRTADDMRDTLGNVINNAVSEAYDRGTLEKQKPVKVEVAPVKPERKQQPRQNKDIDLEI